jgi:hypothetical protein
MRPRACGHASFNGQSPWNQNIIKIEVRTKKTNVYRNTIINLKYYFGILLEGLRITMKTLQSSSPASYQDWNQKLYRFSHLAR